MAAENIQPMIDKVTQAKGTMNSALIFIRGEGARFNTAIQAALALGASEAELKPLIDEVNLMGEQEDALASAIVANP